MAAFLFFTQLAACWSLASTAEAPFDTAFLLQVELTTDNRLVVDRSGAPVGLTLASSVAEGKAEQPAVVPVAGQAGNATAEKVEASTGAGSNASANETSTSAGWCGFQGQSGFIDAYTLPPTNNLLLDLTEGLRNNNSVRFVVTAMTISGAYLDGRGFMTEFASPMEETANTMFEFRLAADNISVDVFRPQLGLRTSDKEMLAALRRGTGSGHFDTLQTYRCAKRSAPAFARSPMQSAAAAMPQIRLQRGQLFEGAPNGLLDNMSLPAEALLSMAEFEAPAQSAGPQRTVISGGALIRKGFFVANQAKQAVSYNLLSVKAYKNNMDVAVEYMMGDGTSLTVGYSLVRLPEVAMKGRPADDRLLYFSTDYKDLGEHARFSDERQAESVDRKISTIWRYNLAALPEQQIRIHIDPTIPKRWRKWFREGVEAWNEAFKEIGKPAAVRAVLPDDPDWPQDYDISDARFNTISWTVSSQVVSMGIAKVDPRSGEILKSDIIMSDGWVRSWLGDLDLLAPNFTHQLEQVQGYRFEAYSDVNLLTSKRRVPTHLPRSGDRDHWGEKLSLLAAAAGQPIKPATRDSILGEGLRHVVTHETGHILGLRHNFKGSLGVSYACTRSRSCSAIRGLTASVMDYIPVNYPTKDAPDVHLFSPVLGEYDKLAIRYGYSVQPEEDQLGENNTLTARQQSGIDMDLKTVLLEAENFQTCYDADRILGQDPMCAAYDMTDDPLHAYQDELRRLVEVQKHLLNNSVQPGASYTHYGDAVENVMSLASNIGVKVIDWLGGMSNQYVFRQGDGKHTTRMARQPVSNEMQKKALALLLAVLRPGKAGLLPPRKAWPYLVSSRGSGSVASLDISAREHTIAHGLLTRALAPAVLARMQADDQVMRGGMSTGEYLDLLTASIFREGVKTSSRKEWDLQRLYVGALATAVAEDALPSAANAHVMRQLQRLRKEASAALLEVDRLPKRASASRVPGENEVLQAHLLSLRQDVQTAICGSSDAAGVALACRPGAGALPSAASRPFGLASLAFLAALAALF